MILFIDTHDSLITIALKTEEKIFLKTKESEYSHSKFVVPMIDEIYKENGLDIKDTNKIIVVNGPGSFTGIRIGLSIAKTMSYALNIDINTISSLKAYLISNKSKEKKMCVIEDNKGYYISAMDENNNVLIEESYVTQLPEGYKIIDKNLDVNKIIDYCNNIKSENCHLIKANYVKKIEVEK